MRSKALIFGWWRGIKKGDLCQEKAHYIRGYSTEFLSNTLAMVQEMSKYQNR